MDLIEEFRALSDELTGRGIEFALCGGLALAIYGAPRATIDIDILVRKESLEEIKQAAGACGFNIDGGLMPMRGGKSPIYRLSKLIEGENDVLILDLLMVTGDLEYTWSMRESRPWQFGSIPVVSLEGLIQLKQYRNGPQDQADIERIRGLQRGDTNVN